MFTDDYYNRLIAPIAEEDEVTDFLNNPGIVRKFSDEDREAMLERWLLANGWVEVNADVAFPEEPDPETTIIPRELFVDAGIIKVSSITHDEVKPPVLSFPNKPIIPVREADAGIVDYN
jgi:hypothetical protein